MKSVRISEKLYRNFKDKLFKYFFYNYGQILFDILGIDEEIVMHLPNEIVESDFKTYLLDSLSKVKSNKLINLEFHSSNLSENDLERYFQYARAAFKKHGIEIESHILMLGDIKENIRKFMIINDLFHLFVLHTLNDYDGEKILEEVEEKINRGIIISDEELTLLILIGFTSFKQDIDEIYLKAVFLIEKLSLIDDQEKDYIKALIELIYRTITGNEVEGKLKGVLNMGPTILEEYLIKHGSELEIQLEKQLEKKYKDQFEEKWEKEVEKLDKEVEAKLEKELEKQVQEKLDKEVEAKLEKELEKQVKVKLDKEVEAKLEDRRKLLKLELEKELEEKLEDERKLFEKELEEHNKRLDQVRCNLRELGLSEEEISKITDVNLDIVNSK